MTFCMIICLKHGARLAENCVLAWDIFRVVLAIDNLIDIGGMS